MSTYRPSRLHYLCSAVCGGHATEDELIELGQILEADLTAQRVYVEHLDIHSTLSELGPLKLHTANTLGREYAARAERKASHGPSLNWICSLAAMVLVSLLTWHLASRADRDEEGRVALNGNPSLNVGQLSIDTGTLQMNLPGVGVLIADGPANMELETPMRLRVDLGRVKLRVTEESGHGFVVSTPHGDVTDLGTEFAVDVGDLSGTNLVVFDGEVDLSIPRMSGDPIIQRLVGGEAVRFARTGQLDRIMSIFTGGSESFMSSDRLGLGVTPLIVNVSDNLPSGNTNRFYEIVTGGFDEDKFAYVDRPYEWNGVSKEGLPKYLVGGDYVRTFNGHKQLEFQLTVDVSRPCNLYVLWDNRNSVAPWLEESFEKLDDTVGLDEFSHPGRRLRDKVAGIGPGNSVNQRFMVWLKVIKQPGKVVLGSLTDTNMNSSMYGIVAVASTDNPAGAHRPGASKASLVIAH